MPEQQTRRMVFHAPYPLNRQATSASGIRPVRMRDAFEELGYEVWEVTGHAAERTTAARKVRDALARGIVFDFCYSESSTMPTSMTEPHHLPTHPLLDLALLRSLHAHGTRVGLFYRDVYWAFDGYGEGLNPAKKQAALAAYRWDLQGYRASVDVLYLPSMKMAPHVPVSGLEMRALPPGHDMPALGEVPTSGVHLFYVGALGAHYRLGVLMQAVQEVAAQGLDVSLTVCTHEAGWEKVRDEYEHLVGGPVRVVHAAGAELQQYYGSSNVATLYVEPSEYRVFAAPVKLYEYVGQAHPILASSGTLTGDFVEQNDFGWTIPYELADATALLRRLAEDPSLVAAKREQLVARRGEHSWLQRARQVADELGRDARITVGSGELPDAAATGDQDGPQRVLLVSAAQSIHTARWANALAARGLEVHLASIHPTRGQHYDPRVQLHLLPNPKGTGYLSAAPALRRLASGLRPDVVNTHYASGYGTLARVALAGLGLPQVLTVWGSDVYEFPDRGRVTGRLLRTTLASADRLTSSSRAMARRTGSFSTLPVDVVPFGIDVDTFTPAEQPPALQSQGREPGVVVVGTVKSLAHIYGIDVLVRAFAKARAELDGRTDLRLKLVGGGTDREQLEQLVHELGVAEVVEFTGAVPYEQVPDQLRSLDVYAALSRHESFGAAILEAGACGLPVVVSDADGPAEVVEQEVTGLVVPREDVDAAAQALVRLALDPELRARMGRAGREHVVRDYSWSHSVDLMVQAYRRAVQDHR